MEKRTKITSWILLLAVLVGLVQTLGDAEMYQAVTSYTNAKEFYESTTQANHSYHAEAAYGRVYYATQAKLASSSTNTRYYTVGFDVTLSGNGHSVSFTVQRQGGSMTQVGNPVRSGNYEYNLYVITEEKLFELATKADSTNAAYVLNASKIKVQMDAIMTTISAGSATPNGGITENGYGGFTHRGIIYRLKDSADLKAMKGIFTGHGFESYKEIRADLDNYLLKVRYNVLGLNPTGNTPVLSNTVYYFDVSGILQKSGTAYADESRTLKKITLLNTGTIGLSKTGYHLPSGSEWVTDNQRYFGSNVTYQSTIVDPTVGYQNHGITLYANWKPNVIKINYNANGGSGTMAPTSTTYDKITYLTKNTFTRTGYAFKGWNTKADGSGTPYFDVQLATNIITGGEITLYAQWEPCVYQISTDVNYDKHSPENDSDQDGTSVFFEKFATGFYSNRDTENGISFITIPSRTGYTFMGYYTYMSGGQIVIDANGKISVPNTFFKNDSIIYADFDANQYTVTFDKQGGIYGTDSVKATYDKVFPCADMPVRNGYVFQGYFTEKNGQGTRVYNENMASDLIYKYTKNLMLYAHWTDESAPELTLNVSHDTWTNQEVTLTAEAWDFGKGLSSAILYRIEADGSLTEVARADNLNGARMKELTFVNAEEGIIRYKAIATDMNGNTSESYNVVFYDITAPSGTVILKETEDGRFYFEIDITDINTGD